METSDNTPKNVRWHYNTQVIYPDEWTDEEVDLKHQQNFASPEELEDLERPWGARARRFQEHTQRGIADILEKVGADETARSYQEDADRLKRVADLIEGDSDDGFDYVNRLLAGTIPELLLTGAAFTLGNVLAPGAGAAVGAARIARLLSKLGKVSKTGVASGIGAGAIPSLGRIVDEQGDEAGLEDYAAAFGASALNFAGLAAPFALSKVANKVSKVRGLSRIQDYKKLPFLQRVGTGMVLGAGAEGITEGLQEALEDAAANGFDEKTLGRVTQAVAGGLTLGAIFGGVGGVLTRERPTPSAEVTPEKVGQEQSFFGDTNPQDNIARFVDLVSSAPPQAQQDFFNALAEQSEQNNQRLDTLTDEKIADLRERMTNGEIDRRYFDKTVEELQSAVNEIKRDSLNPRVELLLSKLAKDVTIEDVLRAQGDEQVSPFVESDQTQLGSPAPLTDFSQQIQREQPPALNASDANFRQVSKVGNLEQGQELTALEMRKLTQESLGLTPQEAAQELVNMQATGAITREGPIYRVNETARAPVTQPEVSEKVTKLAEKYLKQAGLKDQPFVYEKEVRPSPRAMAESEGDIALGRTQGENIEIREGLTPDQELITAGHEGFEYLYKHYLPQDLQNLVWSDRSMDRVRQILRDSGLKVPENRREAAARAFSIQFARNAKMDGNLRWMDRLKKVIRAISRAIKDEPYNIEDLFGDMLSGKIAQQNLKKENVSPEDAAFAVSFKEFSEMRIPKEMGGRIFDMIGGFGDVILNTVETMATKYPSLRPVWSLYRDHSNIRARIVDSLNDLVTATNLPHEEIVHLEKFVEGMMNAGDVRPQKINGIYTIVPTRNGIRSKAGERITISKENHVKLIDSLFAHNDYVIGELATSLEKMTGANRNWTVEQAREQGLEQEHAFIKYVVSLQGKPYFPRVRLNDIIVKAYKLDQNGKKYLAYAGDIPKRTLQSKRQRMDTARTHGESLKAQGYIDYEIVDKANVTQFQNLMEELPLIERMIAMMDRKVGADGKPEAAAYEKELLGTLKQALANQTAKAYTQRSHNIPGYMNEFNEGQYFKPALVRYGHMMAQRIANQSIINDYNAALRSVPDELIPYANKVKQHIFKPGEEWAGARAIAFRYYLSGISSALVNTLQIPQSTYPLLASAYGHKEAAIEIARALKDIRPLVMNLEAAGLKKGSRGRAAFMKKPKGITQTEWDSLMTPLKEKGVLDMVRIDDVMLGDDPRVAEYLQTVGRTTQNVLQALILPFSMTEAANRMATALATYRLAKKHGAAKMAPILRESAYSTSLDSNSAVDMAEFAVNKTQFVMGKYNRMSAAMGRWGAPVRIATQFMDHPIMMAQNMINTLRAYKRVNPNDVAGRELLGKYFGTQIMMMMGTAGLWGLPLAEPMKQLIEAIGTELLDENVDLDAGIRSLLNDFVEDNFLADAILNGGIDALGGPSISGRVGLTLLDDRWTSNNFWQMLGPLGGMVDTLVSRAPKFLAEGREDLAAIALLPPIFKHIAMSIEEYGIPLYPGSREYLTRPQGVRTTQGRVLIPREELSVMDSLWSALGFTTTKEAKAWMLQRAVNKEVGAVQGFKESKTEALVRARLNQLHASDARDRDAAKSYGDEFRQIIQDINEHNREADPRFHVDLKNVLKSVENRVKQDRLGLANRPRQRLPSRSERYIIDRLAPLYGDR